MFETLQCISCNHCGLGNLKFFKGYPTSIQHSTSVKTVQTIGIHGLGFLSLTIMK